MGSLSNTWVASQGGAYKDVVTRIGKAIAIFLMLKNIWKSGELTVRKKIMSFNAIVKSVLPYGCEVWRTTKINQQKIQIFVSRCL